MNRLFEISDEDRDWIDERYPDLHIDDKEKEIKGRIHVNREWNGISVERDIRVRIPLIQNQEKCLPECFVEKEFIDSIVQKYSIKQIDLHVYENYSMCILLKPLENTVIPVPFSFNFFLYKLVEVQLYWLAYYEQYGNEPWRGYDHSIYGYFEAFLDEKINLHELKYAMHSYKVIQWSDFIRFSRKSLCICGSGKLMRKCHRCVLDAAGKVRGKGES